MNSRSLVALSISLLGSLRPSRAARYQPLREAILLDGMLRHGEYEQALELAYRDLHRTDLDKTPVIAYLAALFIDTGRLRDAEKVLNLGGASSLFPPEIGRAAIARERASLLLAREQYDLAASQAIKAYHLAQEDSLAEVRTAYAGSIAVQALVRSGDLNDARHVAGEILKAVPKRVRKARFFVPRILYALALAETYAGSRQRGEAACLCGILISEKCSTQTRDVSLGYVTLAEIRLETGNLAASRDAARRAISLTEMLFGPAHQDIARAREILSQTLENHSGEAYGTDIRHHNAGTEARPPARYAGPARSANA